MSVRKTSSLFSRQFKKQFNNNKYQDLMAQKGSNYSHLGWISHVDMKLGRFVFTFGITGLALCMYLEPSYFHETFGHLRALPKYDFINWYLSGKEADLNEQILKRGHEEHKLDNFVSTLKDFSE